MPFPLIRVKVSRCAALLLLALVWGPNATACASEKNEKMDFLFAAGERIIRESCRSDSTYSQCVGQSGIKCEKTMRLGLDQCVKQFVDIVPDLDVDPKSFGNDDQTPYHTLGEKMGRCLAERHLGSLGIEEAADDCLNTK